MTGKTQVQQFQEFWQKHSDRFLEMALRRDRCHGIDPPHGHGKQTGQCGDTVEFFVKLYCGRVQRVCYECEGCVNTHACCNTVAELTEGKAEKRAWEITPEDVSEYLQTLPADHFHCAELAVGAFYLALKDAGAREF
jgi:nitrogen fixation NifU-like protein